VQRRRWEGALEALESHAMLEPEKARTAKVKGLKRAIEKGLKAAGGGKKKKKK
jgi:hypothetical protein